MSSAALALLTVVSLFGCNDILHKSNRSGTYDKKMAYNLAGGEGVQSSAPALSRSAAEEPSTVPQDASDEGLKERKLTYSGNLSLRVDSLQETGKALESIVTARKGYISNTNMYLGAEATRSASWTVRIPAATFTEAAAALSKLGVVLSSSNNVEDVSASYYDTQTRLNNKKKAEQRLLAILTSSSKVADVISVERELNRVREEIEVQEGQLKYLNHQIAMSTISINAEETGAASVNHWSQRLKTLCNDIGNTILSSSRALVMFIGAVMPWVPLAWVVFYFGRKLWRRRRAKRMGGPIA